jgi:hypothetical protein
MAVLVLVAPKSAWLVQGWWGLPSADLAPFPATLGDDLAPGDGRRGGLGRTGVVLKLFSDRMPASWARRAPSWPRTRPSTRHPDGCPGSANSVQCPRPPAARRCNPATGVQDRRRAEVPGRRDRPRDPARPRRRHPPAAAIRRSGPWSSSARRGGERVDGVAPGCRRSCCAFQRPGDGRDHDANHCDLQDQATVLSGDPRTE